MEGWEKVVDEKYVRKNKGGGETWRGTLRYGGRPEWPVHIPPTELIWEEVYKVKELSDGPICKSSGMVIWTKNDV